MKILKAFFPLMLTFSRVAQTKQEYAAPRNIIVHHEREYQHQCDAQVVWIFVHGLGATGEKQVKRYQALVPDGIFVSFDFPDAKPDKDRYNSYFVNLGQEDDINCLNQVYQEVIKKYPNAKIGFVGVSRGAVTILNFMSSPQYDAKKVAALIVESPFDTHLSIIGHVIKKHHLEWIPGLQTFLAKCFCRKFPRFNPDGPLPLKNITNLANIPTLFIHSKDDELIPLESSESLCKKIGDRSNVHLVVMGGGAKHAQIIVHEIDGKKYKEEVYQFCKKYEVLSKLQEPY